MESVIFDKIPPKPAPERVGAVDRSKTCPILLRVFVNKNRHNALSDYSRNKVPNEELQIYTWIDATLKEITSLIRAVHPPSRRTGSTFQFSIVYAEPQGRSYRTRDIGEVTPGRPGPDDHVTLAVRHYKIGDYLDIAVFNPRDDDVGGMRGGDVGRRGRGRGGRMRPYYETTIFRVV